ncbi:hypothetical protein D3C83_120400 [compost metagenome]
MDQDKLAASRFHRLTRPLPRLFVRRDAGAHADPAMTAHLCRHKRDPGDIRNPISGGKPEVGGEKGANVVAVEQGDGSPGR